MESARAASARDLQIYFIDVEGGQSTLVVTPRHHSLLIDAGFAGSGTGFQPGDPHKARDANRIVAAAKAAGISQIDYLLVTHFHADHDGGVTELAQLMPIQTFVDHGSPSPEAMATSAETKRAFEAYSAARSGALQHLEPGPGEHLVIDGIEITVVSSAGRILSAPLPHAGGANHACQPEAVPARDPYENPRSTGIVLRYGRFRFLDLGDLSGQPLFALACPADLIGPVDVYLVAHHGGPDVADPATFAAFRPRVAVMNNGLEKGGALLTYQVLHQVPGLESVWQLHRSADAGQSNFGAEFIANPDTSTAYWIRLSAAEDGSFEILNLRTSYSKRYPPRAHD